jgi:hypothetical protein
MKNTGLSNHWLPKFKSGGFISDPQKLKDHFDAQKSIVENFHISNCTLTDGYSSLDNRVQENYGGNWEWAKKEALEGALRFAQQLGYRGDELPIGTRGDSDMCPLARATGYTVGSRFASKGIDDSYRQIEVPATAKLFIQLFDAGHYDDLVDPEKPSRSSGIVFNMAGAKAKFCVGAEVEETKNEEKVEVPA